MYFGSAVAEIISHTAMEMDIYQPWDGITTRSINDFAAAFQCKPVTGDVNVLRNKRTIWLKYSRIFEYHGQIT